MKECKLQLYPEWPHTKCGEWSLCAKGITGSLSTYCSHNFNVALVQLYCARGARGYCSVRVGPKGQSIGSTVPLSRVSG